ncbi:hypothetical protein [Streptosporangium sp. KLBMP 9127]|nr:hypothetical protein [Streptosporangium sp. KLBMP 9127]
MNAVHPGRPVRRYGRGEQIDTLAEDLILGALSRREPLPVPGDPAVRLLAALIDDVDQRRSSVSMTPST